MWTTFRVLAALRYVTPIVPPLSLLFLGLPPLTRFFLYTGHGGVAWLLLPLCLPYVVLMLGLLVWRSVPGTRLRALSKAAVVVLFYVAAAYPLAEAVNYRIVNSFGLRWGENHQLFKLAVFPVGLLLPPYSSPAPPGQPAAAPPGDR